MNLFRGVDNSDQNPPAMNEKPRIPSPRTFIVWTPSNRPEGETVYAHSVEIGESGTLMFQTVFHVGDSVAGAYRRGFKVWEDYKEVVLDMPNAGLLVQ